MQNTKESEKWTWGNRTYFYEIGVASWVDKDAVAPKDISIRMNMHKNEKDGKEGLFMRSSPEIPMYAVEDFVKICADEGYLDAEAKRRIIYALIDSFITTNEKNDKIRTKYTQK